MYRLTRFATASRVTGVPSRSLIVKTSRFMPEGAWSAYSGHISCHVHLAEPVGLSHTKCCCAGHGVGGRSQWRLLSTLVPSALSGYLTALRLCVMDAASRSRAYLACCSRTASIGRMLWKRGDDSLNPFDVVGSACLDPWPPSVGCAVQLAAGRAHFAGFLERPFQRALIDVNRHRPAPRLLTFGVVQRRRCGRRCRARYGRCRCAGCRLDDGTARGRGGRIRRGRVVAAQRNHRCSAGQQARQPSHVIAPHPPNVPRIRPPSDRPTSP